MATVSRKQLEEILTTRVSVGEYLRTRYEDGDREYVDGVVEERTLGTRSHAELQKRLVRLLEERGLYAIQEVRLRVSPIRYRVPDVQAYREEPLEQVFTRAPLLIAEIWSPDDREERVRERIEDYGRLGVRYLYVLGPEGEWIKRWYADTFHTVDQVEWHGGYLTHKEIWP
jgi:Uma2 family endonuclease